MDRVCEFGISITLAVLLAGSALNAQSKRPVQTSAKPTESGHVKGPHGLEGWTLNWPLPDGQYDGEKFAFTLILARNGRILHRVEGSPIIWKWMFLSDGRQVAYETGPLHFSMMCVLIDTESGRRLADYDCYTYPGTKPDWVNALGEMP